MPISAFINSQNFLKLVFRSLFSGVPQPCMILLSFISQLREKYWKFVKFKWHDIGNKTEQLQVLMVLVGEGLSRGGQDTFFVKFINTFLTSQKFYKWLYATDSCAYSHGNLYLLLYLFIWLPRVLVVAHWLVSCSSPVPQLQQVGPLVVARMWDLVP